MYTYILSIFTGFIGGSVLYRLLSHPSAKTFDITVLMRDARKASIAQSKLGVKAVVGTLSEEAKLEALAQKAHVVISCVRMSPPHHASLLTFHCSQADADDLKSVQAILRGLSKRHATIGDLPILIHTVRPSTAISLSPYTDLAV